MKQYLMSRFTFAARVMSLLVVAFTGIQSQAQTQTATRPSQMVVTTAPDNGSVTVQITVPADVQIDTLSAKLNGKDVSASLTPGTCPHGVCEQATFTAPDGLKDSKNVLSVVANRKDGSLVSVRTRFVGMNATATSNVHAAIAGARAVHANAVSALPTLNSFLPPAIAFTTLVPGGYNGSPWLKARRVTDLLLQGGGFGESVKSKMPQMQCTLL